LRPVDASKCVCGRWETIIQRSLEPIDGFGRGIGKMERDREGNGTEGEGKAEGRGNG